MTGLGRIAEAAAWQGLIILATLIVAGAAFVALAAALDASCRWLFSGWNITGRPPTRAEEAAIRQGLAADLASLEATGAERLADRAELEALADAVHEPRRVGTGRHPCGCIVVISAPGEVTVTPCCAHDPQFVSQWEARL